MPPAYPQREYGLGKPGETRGIPKATAAEPDIGPCPNCGCETLFTIEVEVANPMLTTGRGCATYIGCPACPWASPAMVRAIREEKEE